MEAAGILAKQALSVGLGEVKSRVQGLKGKSEAASKTAVSGRRLMNEKQLQKMWS